MPRSAFAVERRSSRASSARPADGSGSPTTKLDKAKLPRLKGMPSSRRQYTYGSAEEPMPSRHRVGEDEDFNLGNAVGKFLSFQEAQDEASSLGGSMPPPARPNTFQDNLLKITRSRESSQQPPQRQPNTEPESASTDYSEACLNSFEEDPDILHHQQLEDLGEIRSYDTENGFYGDVTIASSPGARPVIHEVAPSPATRPMRQSNLRNATETSPIGPSEELLSNSPLRQSTRRSSRHLSQPSEQSKLTQPPEQLRPSQSGQQGKPSQTGSLRRSPRKAHHEDVLDQRAEIDVMPTDTMGRIRFAAMTSARMNGLLSGETNCPPSAETDRTGSAPAADDVAALYDRRKQQIDADQPYQSHHISEPRSSRIKRAALSAFRGASSPKEVIGRAFGFAGHRTQPQVIRSDYSEQDDEIQKEIEAAEEREQDASVPHVWRDRWTKVKNFSPFKASFSPDFEDSDEEDQEEEFYESDVDEDDFGNAEATNWWRLLSPFTYLNAMLRVIDAILDRLVHPCGGSRMSVRAPDWLKLLVAGLGALLLAMLMPWATTLVPWNTVNQYKDSISASILFPDIPIPSWSVGIPFRNIGDYVPSVSMPSWSRDNHFGDLREGGQHADDVINRINQEFNNLKKSSKLHADSLKKLKSVVPHVVHMELKNNKPVISDDFWHAMRDLIQVDDSILTINGKKQLSSDKHWQMIAQKLVADPTFTNKLDMTVDGAENRLDKKMTGFWDGWVKKNEEKVRSEVGDAIRVLKSGVSENISAARIEALVKEELKKQPKNADSTFVSRDEFLKHIKNEFSVHRLEIRAELDELKPKIEMLIRDSVEMAKSGKGGQPSIMTKSDVTNLVNGLVRKSLADLNLAAMANGKIHAHWDHELKNQVNYFAIGAGATINGKKSSKLWNPNNAKVMKDGEVTTGLRNLNPFPHTMALMPWSDEGDCFCATLDKNHRGNPHSAMLVVQMAKKIVPQHFVIEHILPGATSDPGARPRHIELHAEIADHETRERVRDFAATHFPEPTLEEDWNYQPAQLDEKFVKIGELKYEGAVLHDGVHVHRLSDELQTMGVETDHVAVRAVSNHGAKQHTCFYRVRLYGAKLDEQ